MSNQVIGTGQNSRSLVAGSRTSRPNPWLVIIPLALFVLITIATFYPDPHENEAVQAYVYAQGGDVAALNLESCKDTGRTDGMMDYPLYRCVFTSDELSPSEVDAIVTHQLNGGCFAVYGDPGEDRGLEAEITGGCDKKR